MKLQKYHSVGTVRNSNRKIVEGDKVDISHKYMTTLFPVLVHVIYIFFL